MKIVNQKMWAKTIEAKAPKERTKLNMYTQEERQLPVYVAGEETCEQPENFFPLLSIKETILWIQGNDWAIRWLPGKQTPEQHSV